MEYFILYCLTMTLKCACKSKHGKQCAVVISDDESDSENDYESSFPIHRLLDIEV